MTMYTDRNFKTKKALKEAITAGREIGVYQHNDMFGRDYSTFNGTVSVEGPHFPAAHTWYARVTLENGKIVKVQ